MKSTARFFVAKLSAPTISRNMNRLVWATLLALSVTVALASEWAQNFGIKGD
jgi:hypothetical protein